MLQFDQLLHSTKFNLFFQKVAIFICGSFYTWKEIAEIIHREK